MVLRLRSRVPKDVSSITADKYNGRDVSQFRDSGFDASWLDDKNTPVPHEPFLVAHLLWVPCLLGIAWFSIQAIDSGNVWVSLAWLIYECYIVFDHFPFLCTNDLYTSARFNYEITGPHVFWGMEAMSSVVSGLSVLNAPAIVWLNLPNHSFFILSNYLREVATSKAFTWERKAVSPWLVAAVAMDTTIHTINMRCHLIYLLEGDTFTVTMTWLGLLVAMIVSTVYFHRQFMAWEHFMLYFGWRPQKFATSAPALVRQRSG